MAGTQQIFVGNESTETPKRIAGTYPLPLAPGRWPMLTHVHTALFKSEPSTLSDGNEDGGIG